MTRLKGSQFEAQSLLHRSQCRISSRQQFHGGYTLSLTHEQNGAVLTAVVPSLLCASGVILTTVKFGLAVTVPFGLSTEYDTDWVGANANVKSEIKTLNIAPALAYKVTDQPVSRVPACRWRKWKEP